MRFSFALKIFKRHAAKKHLKQLQKVKREKHHPLIHKIHHVHRISKKTLFYVKEYGLESNVPRTILKESLKIVLLTALISSLGGFALEQMKMVLISMIPFIILLPALNDMVGDYGTIVSSRFSTMLHKGSIKKNWWREAEVQELFVQIMLIAGITAIISAGIAVGIASLAQYNPLSVMFIAKVFMVTLIDVLLVVALLFFISLFAGQYYFKKKEDPNNFLIPITTSIADFGNMVILAGLILLFF